MNKIDFVSIWLDPEDSPNCMSSVIRSGLGIDSIEFEINFNRAFKIVNAFNHNKNWDLMDFRLYPICSNFVFIRRN